MQFQSCGTMVLLSIKVVSSLASYSTKCLRILWVTSTPKQRDNSSCGVGALTNAYFFMHEKRLATIFDYTPDYNGIVGLKRFILAKLMEQEALQAFPQLFAFEGAAENEEMGYARQFEVILNGAGQEYVQILDDAAADKQEMEDIKKALLESKRELNQLEQKEASSVNANVIDLR